MAGYYNPPAYSSAFPPPFPPPQQSPPNTNYNAYSPPTGYEHQQQYSPTGQNMFGLEPTTPVLDQNQMNYFWNEVRSGNIPTIPSAQPQAQPFAPPQAPPQSYEPQYGYPQYGQQTQTSPLQAAFQPPPKAYYNANQDVPMADASFEDEEWTEDDEAEYSPPNISAQGNMNGTGQVLPGLDQVAQGKKPQDSTQQPPNTSQPPPFNPFKALSHYEPAPAPPQNKIQTQAKPQPVKQQTRQNLALREQARNAIKDFHEHGIGYSQLAQEPNFDDLDKNLLRQIYAQYNVPQEPAPVAPIPVQDLSTTKNVDDEKILELKRVLGGAGFNFDDATLASLAGTPQASALVQAVAGQQEGATLADLNSPQNRHQPQDAGPAPPNRSLSTSTPGADAATPAEGRSAYLAKLKAMKGKGAASQQSTPVPAAAKANLPGLGASTPRRAVINRDALQRKLQAQREAQARAAQQSVSTATRPEMPSRTESMSSINFESGQVSGQSDSDVTNTPVMDMSSPEEGEDLEEGEELEEPGEIVEAPAPPLSTLQPSASIPGLPPKPPETNLPPHVRNDSDQSARGSPRNCLPARPPATRQPYPYPPAVPSPRAYAQPWQQDQHLKRPASSAFGSPWNPQAKRQYPPHQMQDVPEPVVIDISSEEGEMSEDEDEDGLDAVAGTQNLPRRPDVPAQQMSTPWKPQQQIGTPSAVATPPVVSTPDPIQAAAMEEVAKKNAFLMAKKEALIKEIQRREAESKQPAVRNTNPAAAGAAVTQLSAPIARTALVSSIPASSVLSRGQPTRNTSSPFPASLSRGASSVVHHVAIKSLDAELKSDQDQLEALQQQMERLRQEMARKNAEKAALAEEIKAFGVNPEGMSHERMQEVRDSLAEEAAIAEVERIMAVDKQEKAEDDDEDDNNSKDGNEEDDEEEPKVAASEDGEEGEIEETLDIDIPEANDPRAVESGARIQIHHVPLTFTKVDIRHLLSEYDITGISLPIHDSPNKKKKAGYAYVDFLYPAEVQQAVTKLRQMSFAGNNVIVHLVKPTSTTKAKAAAPAQTRREKQDATKLANNVVPFRVFISNLPVRLCNASSFKGYIGNFSTMAKYMIFPVNPQTKKPIGHASFTLPDQATAQKAANMLRNRKNGKARLDVKVSAFRDPAQQAAGPSQAQASFPSFSSAPAERTMGGTAVAQGTLAVNAPAVEDEDSGSESDDEESGEDAMSVSDSGSEEGEVAEDTESQAQPSHTGLTQPVADDEDSEDDSDEEGEVTEGEDIEGRPAQAVATVSVTIEEESDDEMDESSSEDEEVTGDVGVSLKDVEDVAMDEDAASNDDDSEESEEEDVPSDDEEGEVEEPVQQTMPQAESDENKSGTDTDTSEEGSVAEENAAQVFESQQTEVIVAQSDAMAGIEESAAQPIDTSTKPTDSAAGPPELELPATSSKLDQPAQSKLDETVMADEIELVDDNDEDFYEPYGNIGGSPSAQLQTEATGKVEEDDYDPDFDAAFEEAFAEMDDDSVKSGGNAGEVPPSAVTVNGTSANNVQQQQLLPESEEAAQPDRNGGIPGLSFF
jgi:hypothetical protein